MSESQDYTIDQTTSARSLSGAPTSSQRFTGDSEVKTAYEYLQEQFSKEVINDPITLAIPNRPGVYIRFNTNIDKDQLDAWQKQATLGNRRQRRSGEEKVDELKLTAIVVLNQCEAFVVNDEDVEVDKDVVLTFWEREYIRRLTGRPGITDEELVRDVYRNDGHILDTGMKVIEAAGFGDEVQEMVSPTKR